MDESITMRYTNYKGVTSMRDIKPLLVYVGSTDWHTGTQYLLKAWDYGKEAERDFSLKDCDFAFGSLMDSKIYDGMQK